MMCMQRPCGRAHCATMRCRSSSAPRPALAQSFFAAHPSSARPARPWLEKEASFASLWEPSLALGRTPSSSIWVEARGDAAEADALEKFRNEFTKDYPSTTRCNSDMQIMMLA